VIKQIIARIRLFHNEKKESYFSFYRILGFFPENIDLYEEALRHRSSPKEVRNGKTINNNERLEFLGDGVLNAVIADVVFRKFRTKKEGFLTNTRSKIVQRETLNHIAIQLGLDRLVVLASKLNTQKSHVFGNALEALVGAVYLDKGYEKAKEFILTRMLYPYINIDAIAEKEINFKSKLLEWSQKNKVIPAFNLLETFTDENNNPVFQTQVTLNGHFCGIGVGYSKKESQQNAAKMALGRFGSDPGFITQISVPKDENSVSFDIEIE
jgi:ribonuclease III, bacterial